MFEFATQHECLILDAEHIVIFDEAILFAGGEWIDDGQILQEKWEPGMNVRAINYCISDDSNYFVSMQLLVGPEGSKRSDWIPLRKHGQNGGICRRWNLKDGDYIRNV